MKFSYVMGSAVLAMALSISAQAACGGGGYKPSTTSSSSSSSSQTVSSDSRAITGRNSSKFDVSYFHNMSGQLHMSGEQASAVINMIQDIRKKLDESATPPKDYDPKADFEKRLATILNAEQMKSFQSQGMAKKS